jgi:hypothetical protein
VFVMAAISVELLLVNFVCSLFKDAVSSSDSCIIEIASYNTVSTLNFYSSVATL